MPFSQQLEALGRMIFPLKDTIIELSALIATMEAGAPRTSAIASLGQMKKSDDEMRKQLFCLQIWKKHGREIAVKYNKRKRGEYLDNNLAKVLEDKDKIEAKKERDREAAKKRTAKRAKYNQTNNYPGTGSSGGNQ